MKAFIDWYEEQEPIKQMYIETIIDYLMKDQLVELIGETLKYKQDLKIQTYANCNASCISKSVLRIKPIDPKHAINYWKKEREKEND